MCKLLARFYKREARDQQQTAAIKPLVFALPNREVLLPGFIVLKHAEFLIINVLRGQYHFN
jgi:hypothetical protein